MSDKIELTKEQFEAYEDVRESGVTNMFMIGVVEEISGLEKDTIITIMKNYKYLEEKFPGVRK